MLAKVVFLPIGFWPWMLLICSKLEEKRTSHLDQVKFTGCGHILAVPQCSSLVPYPEDTKSPQPTSQHPEQTALQCLRTYLPFLNPIGKLSVSTSSSIHNKDSDRVFSRSSPQNPFLQDHHTTSTHSTYLHFLSTSQTRSPSRDSFNPTSS